MCGFPDSWSSLFHSLTLKPTILFKANAVSVSLLDPAILLLSPLGSHQLLLSLKYFCTLFSVQPQLLPIVLLQLRRWLPNVLYLVRVAY